MGDGRGTVMGEREWLARRGGLTKAFLYSTARSGHREAGGAGKARVYVRGHEHQRFAVWLVCTRLRSPRSTRGDLASNPRPTIPDDGDKKRVERTVLTKGRW